MPPTKLYFASPVHFAAGAGNPKAASNWVMGELTRKLNETRGTIEEVPLAPDALALRLFAADPPPAPAPGAAITADQRDAFYLWWLFVRSGKGGVAAALEGLIDR